jgi:hypothetical protein
MNTRQIKALLTALMISIVLTLAAGAQVQTQTSTTSHPATVETSVQRGEVVYAQGNELIVKMEDGTLDDFRNIPESSKLTVDGKEIGIHDVKVGMKLEKTITTTSTPKTITTVQTVTGTVWQVNPPTSVVLRLEDNTAQQFTIPKDQQFNIDGRMVDAWGLKKGMRISATKVVEVPEVHITQEHQVTGTMPPPPVPPPDQPILVVLVPHPAAPPAQAAETAKATPSELPKTGSPLPLIYVIGLLSITASFGLKLLRMWN